MERLHLSLFAVVLVLLGPAQLHAQEGAVTYEETVTLPLDLPPEMEPMREHIPRTRTVTKQLFFNEAASLMKNVPQEDEESSHRMQDGNATMHVRMMGDEPESETYVNVDEGQRIEKRDFLGRTFLITGEPLDLNWRLTNEHSEFLGYMAQKATAVYDSTTVEAWFTPEIPVPAGPASYGGLPGLILVLSLDDGQTTYVAQELSLTPIDEAMLVPPTEGRNVTRAEFDTIVAEKMKELEAERGGGGNLYIRRRN